MPAGITAVEGDFEPGSTISVKTAEGHELARGLVHYSSAELKKIGQQARKDIEALLGHKNFDEVIHRDDLVIL